MSIGFPTTDDDPPQYIRYYNLDSITRYSHQPTGVSNTAQRWPAQQMLDPSLMMNQSTLTGRAFHITNIHYNPNIPKWRFPKSWGYPSHHPFCLWFLHYEPYSWYIPMTSWKALNWLATGRHRFHLKAPHFTIWSQWITRHHLAWNKVT